MENIQNMNNYELGKIVKAYAECGSYICSDCPCDGVLCAIGGWEYQKIIILEVANRLMNT